jgi:hypothetical protein
MNRQLPLAVALLFVGACPSLAQWPEREDYSDAAMSARMNRIEAENESLRSEMQWMRENSAPARIAPQNPVMPVSAEIETISASAPSLGQDSDVDYYTLPQLQAEMKKLAWTKGDFKITPYGTLWGNMVYTTEQTNNGTYTLYTYSASTQGEDAFIVDGRNTRLGFDVAGPRVPFFNCAQSGGKVEIDFQNSVLTTENKATVLLRHAYWEVKDEQFRLLFGQTWDVMSPLIPGTLLYTVGWDGGNMGYRRAQLRGERYLAFSDTSLLTLQTSLNQQVFVDSITSATGEVPDWPIIEARTAITLGERGPNCRPITFGVSGHIGETQFDYAPVGGPSAKDVRRTTWSLNADFRAPINERMGFQAEWFTGSNLGAFLGGVGQGIDTTTFNPIRSNGGWLEMWYDWTPRFHSHFGYSIDDPDDNDLTTTGARKYNSYYFGNFSYDLTKSFLVGVEVSSWRTLYVNQLPGDAVRMEFAAKYSF